MKLARCGRSCREDCGSPSAARGGIFEDGRLSRYTLSRILQGMTEQTEEHWDGARVRRLRGHLEATQAQFAARLGTRQQTVSEWETGASRPRGMSRRLLRLVAEEAGFYGVEGSQHSRRDDADKRA